MTLQEQLCEKMRVEQSAYCLWLTAQPPEEILHHAQGKELAQHDAPH